MKMPSVFQFRDCRTYLKAALEFQKSLNRKYSLAYYSARIGRSSAYLKQVFSGRRELSLDTAALLGKALKLNSKERAYLVHLAIAETAESTALRSFASSHLVNLKRENIQYDHNRGLATVFENSLLWEIFSLIGIEDFEANPRWISSHLRRRDKSVFAIQGALRALEKMGVVINENGKFRAADIVLKHGYDVNRVYLTAARRQIEHLALEPNDSSHHFDSFCLILSESEYDQIRDVLEETKLKIGQIARSRNSPKTRIAYYNAGLFWASS
jgi:uncharacterized protein (TIGR02147 family)